MMSLSKRVIKVLLVLGSTFAVYRPLNAQEIRVRLVDGRTGNAIGHSYVNVWVGDQRKSALVVLTDQDGIARLRLTNDQNDVHLNNEASSSGLTNPLLLYAASIRVNIGYASCDPNQRKNSWLAIRNFSTAHLIADGEVTPNSCRKIISKTPTPGELTIYVRPLTFWEKLRQ